MVGLGEWVGRWVNGVRRWVSGEWIDEWAGGRKEKDTLAGWINR